MQHKIKHCYLCRVPLAKKDKTRDHIPPQNLFREPLPNNLITVPCCSPCNKSFTLLDERFRAYITMLSNVSEVGTQTMRERVFGGSFKRSKPLRAAISERVTLGHVTTPQGTFELPIINPGDADFNAFLIRITKGLLANFHPETDYFSHTFTAELFHQFGANDSRFKTLASAFTADERGNGVFKFWRLFENGDPQNGGRWMYQFYDSAVFYVRHGSEL